MGITKIAVFMSENTKVIRGILVPDADENLVNVRAPKGENMLIVPAFQSPERGVFDPANHQHVIDQVTQITGVVPPDPICAVVNEHGVVENLIHAEETETLPGKVLVEKYHDDITIGCTFDAQTREFTVPAREIPAKTDRFGQPVAAKTIPAKVLTREAQADGVLLQD
jgi:hypothetical protein